MVATWRERHTNPLRVLLGVADVLDCVVVGLPTVVLATVGAMSSRRKCAKGRRLLVLDVAYSLRTIRARALEHSLLVRDLDGFFSHVWSVNPLVDADQAADSADGYGRSRMTQLGPAHTVIEATVGRFEQIRDLPLLNFVLAQAGLMAQLVRLIRNEDISVIRAGDPYYLGLLGLALARLNGIPLVVRINGNYDAIYASVGRPAYPRLFRWRHVEKIIERIVLPRADLVAGANRENLDYAIRNGARKERSALFRYGNLIDPVHFADPAGRGEAPRDVPADRHYLIWVGRYEMLKHPDDVIRVLKLVRDELSEDIAAVMVGSGSAQGELVRLSASLGVELDVLFVGPRPQTWVASAMAHADVILSPMTGRALVEAALSGRPIVAYDVDWHRELVHDEKTGRLVPYRDVHAMASATSALLRDPARARALGAAGRSAALRTMDPATLTTEEAKAYLRVLREPGQQP